MNDYAETQPDNLALDPDIKAATSELMELKPLATNAQHHPTHKVSRFDLTNDYNLMLATAQQLQGEVNHWHGAAVNARGIINDLSEKYSKTIEDNKKDLDMLRDEIGQLSAKNSELAPKRQNSRLSLTMLLMFGAYCFAVGYFAHAVFGG